MSLIIQNAIWIKIYIIVFVSFFLRRQMLEKMKKREEIERAKILEKEKFTDNIIHHGLWQSHSEIDNMLASYSTATEKREALKCQLQFRKGVLTQVTEDKTLFNYSKKAECGDTSKRRQLTVEELTANLKVLVHQAIVRSGTEETHMLVGKRVKHIQVEEGERTPYYGKILSQVPGYPEWFNIIYDDDDSVYTYHRLDEDFERGDIEILV